MPGPRLPEEGLKPNYRIMDDLLVSVLEKVKYLAKAGREAGYEEFVELVELRQALTDLVLDKGNLTPHVKMIVDEILSYDPQILAAMKALKDEAEEGLSRIHSSRKQRSLYNQQEAYDSIMFDAKK
jgi:hypothetical protein